MLQSGKYNTDQPASPAEGDINGDGKFNQLDLTELQIATKYNRPTFQAGDANMDGVFNRLDIVHLLQQDKYLSDEPADWGSGDFDGDGLFDADDIVMALQEGNYQGHSFGSIGGGPVL